MSEGFVKISISNSVNSTEIVTNLILKCVDLYIVCSFLLRVP